MIFFSKFAFRSARRCAFLVAALSVHATGAAAAQQNVLTNLSGQSSVRLEADQQRKEGDSYIAEGNVEILYKNVRLRADRVQYDTKTY